MKLCYFEKEEVQHMVGKDQASSVQALKERVVLL